MSCYGKDKSNEMPHGMGNFLAGFVRVLMKVCWRLKIENLENVRIFKGRCGLVVVSNHTSYLDVATIYCSIRLEQ